MLMHTLRFGLELGKMEVFPSFFASFQCPSVARYEMQQSKVIKERVDSLITAMDKKQALLPETTNGGSDDDKSYDDFLQVLKK
ncbi:hypothetical protein ACHAWF_009382 [Thalassiosira exigua]